MKKLFLIIAILCFISCGNKSTDFIKGQYIEPCEYVFVDICDYDNGKLGFVMGDMYDDDVAWVYGKIQLDISENDTVVNFYDVKTSPRRRPKFTILQGKSTITYEEHHGKSSNTLLYIDDFSYILEKENNFDYESDDYYKAHKAFLYANFADTNKE